MDSIGFYMYSFGAYLNNMWQLYNRPEIDEAERANSQLTRGSSLASWRVEEWAVLKNVTDRKLLDYFKDRQAASIGCEALRDDCFIESVTVLTNGRIGYPLDHLRVVSIDH